MLLFASLATLLVVATLALLLVPLLRGRRAGEAPGAEAAAAAVYRDQKRALDAEFADGVISAEEREAAIAELAHRLAEDVERPRERATPALPRRSAWVLAAVLLVLIPAAAIVLYSRLGKPDAIATQGEQAAHELSDQQVNALVDTLAQRLKARPDDAEGWVLLARSYRALERWDEAAAAYAHAIELVPNDPSLLADYADVLAVTQGRRLEGKPAALAARALALDPNHRKALALAATAAMEVRDYDGAIALWQRLRAQFPQSSDDAKQVTSFIAEVEDMKRHPDAGTQAAAAQSPRAPPAAASPREMDQAAAPVAAAAPGIAGRVEVAPALASKVALTDTVFIYARPAEGPRMPLAVLRIPAKELPASYRLDDSMGMAGAKLSTAPTVVVEARISKSGNAIPQPGDLSGKSGPVKPGASGVNVTIDQVVP
ncbi:MAG TPA: c-type cytochrome biogenesis protein CcmI [Casimicrobiaceae bacterium]|nr:c-type cytochrome biogenesis protein CcmI [Casimicrobiaceae bacterium]